MTEVIKAMSVPLASDAKQTTDAHENGRPAMAETTPKSFDEHLENINKRVVPAPVVDGIQTVEAASSSSSLDESRGAEVVPDPPVPVDTREPIQSRRAKARTRRHLIYHESLCDPDVDCPGCLAKTRDKSHFAHSFDRSDKRYATTVTLDQVGFSSKKASSDGKKLPYLRTTLVLGTTVMG